MRLTAANTAIQADFQAIYTAINNDSTVQAARTKLQTDQQPIIADEAVVMADYVQLQKDVQAQNAASGTNTPWWWF